MLALMILSNLNDIKNRFKQESFKFNTPFHIGLVCTMVNR